jgi:phosphoglycerate kinase
MPDYNTLDDIAVTGKRVLVRSDLNVPLKDGAITDATRIERQAPTIRELADKGAKVIILSHFDRPKGKVVPSMSLKPVVAPLASAIGRPVAFAEDCVGEKAQAAVQAMKDGDVLLLENTRFHAGEEANDPGFTKQVSALGDIFVNDAFSAAHRPLLAVVGGAKVSTKIELLQNLVTKVEVLVIGGAMANTFLAAEGVAVGKSLYELDHLETARKVLHMAHDSGAVILLPSDVVVAKQFKAGADHRTVKADEIADDEMVLDVGPASIQAFKDRLATTKTLVWNGPFGAFEMEPFDAGTVAAAKAVADATKAGNLLSVAGGGDTLAALAHAGVESDFSYVSTAGGAFLEWLEGKELPGVEALKTAKARG